MVDISAVDGASRADVLELAAALATAAVRSRGNVPPGPAADTAADLAADTAMHPVLAALAHATRGGPAAPGPRQAPLVGGDGVEIGSAEVRELRAEPVPGTGLSGLVRTAHGGLLLGRRVVVGSPAWLAAEGARPAPETLERTYALAAAALTPAVMVAWNGTVRAVLTLTP